MNNDSQRKKITIIYANDIDGFVIEFQSLSKDTILNKCAISNGHYDENIIEKAKHDLIAVFLSKEILTSQNIVILQNILSFINKYEDDLYKICIYIIQDTLLALPNQLQWIEKYYNFNLKLFKSPYMVVKDLEEKYRKLIWRKNPFISVLENTFVGRNQEIGVFQNKYYSDRGYNYKALIVSGREGVGKDVFSRYCLKQMGFQNEYEPYTISLSRTSSIENFILQLNSIERLFSISELKEKLAGDIEDKVNIAVDLLNELFESKDVLFIEDAGACVLPQREPAQWLIDIINNPKLKLNLDLFVKSKFIPRTTIENDYPNILHIHLAPLSSVDRKKLFYLFCRTLIPQIHVSDDDANFFVDRLYFSPTQLITVVYEIERYHGNIEYVKEHIDKIITVGDKKARPILQLFDDRPEDEKQEYRDLLYILSKFEYISFDILKRIIGERYNEVLDMISYLIVYGVVELFGQSEEYIRLDHYISDYINRNHMKMSPASLSAFEDTMGKYLEKEIENMSEDVSLYLYEMKQNLENFNKSSKITEEYLIPSIVLKVIINKYNLKEYKSVIKLCENTLDDGYHYYEEIRQEVRYWQCAAICRDTDKKNISDFENIVNQIKEISVKKYLLGLYAMCNGRFAEGEKSYKEALQRAPGMGKAKRELVMCLMAQDKYSEALAYARENYEQQSENVYYIQTYFRCLVRKTNISKEDLDIINMLMEEGEELAYENKKDSIAAAMKIDYKVFIEQTPPAQILDFINQKEYEFPKSKLIKRIGEEHKLRFHTISTTNKFEEDWSYE